LGDREAQVKSMAREVGFSLVGIAPVTPHERSNRVMERWLAGGMHGEMAWLERHRPGREDPSRLLEGARSAICVAVNYYHEVEKEQRRMDGSDGRGAFSIYVHHEDYHGPMMRMLAELEERLRSVHADLRATACVDTRPVSDRALALRAGVGWLGKNTAVISPRYGSWIFLGELITNLELAPDSPLDTLCGTCSRCVDACPTGALDTPFVLDARRCISYLTIEKRGPIEAELHEPIGLDVYGCDTCQSVCPFNDVATESTVFERDKRSPLVDAPLETLATIGEVEFRELTRDSAIRRCRSEGMRRNAEIVRANVSRGMPDAAPGGR
jgi:epoxyqueuosine reductase